MWQAKLFCYFYRENVIAKITDKQLEISSVEVGLWGRFCQLKTGMEWQAEIAALKFGTQT